LMPRNLNRRVEVLFPIESQRIVRRIRDRILAKYLADEACAHIMQPDGQYHRVKTRPGKHPVNAQDWFLKHEA